MFKYGLYYPFKDGLMLKKKKAPHNHTVIHHIYRRKEKKQLKICKKKLMKLNRYLKQKFLKLLIGTSLI